MPIIHRHKIETDPKYEEVVRDSRRKWRQAHPDYPDAAEQNRRRQWQRDSKRRLQNLVKNNLVLDLKQTEAEIYLFGPAAGDLVKNNLVGSQLLIFQPVTSAGAILEKNNVMV